MWSWDITALKGPAKGLWYKCYVVIDVFSRYVTGWLVAAAEDSAVAKDFLGEAIARNGVEPHTIHADCGGATVCKPISELLTDLGVLGSHSRPRTSNDNPYSEAQFKTMKYVPDFPARFGSLEDARAFCDGFFLAASTTSPWTNQDPRTTSLVVRKRACDRKRSVARRCRSRSTGCSPSSVP